MPSRSLLQILATARERNSFALIVDVKMRSPRDGQLIEENRLESYVDLLVSAGVDALSMPTDATYFGGSLALARRVRARCDLPLLRKEFFVDPSQLDESQEAGFDAVQLSLGTIPDAELFARLRGRAEQLGLQVVIGVHGRAQLERAIALDAQIIGLNNRDITQLELDAGTVSSTAELLPRIPDDVLVISESALLTRDDVRRAASAGAHGMLIGTAVARHPDPAGWIRSLRAHTTCPR